MKSQAADIPVNIIRCPVESISGVWKFVRPPGHRSHTCSTPGHLLQLVLTGAYRLRTNEREYQVHAGDLVYYHETEEVWWLGNEEQVSFYSVAFQAPAVQPLAMDDRVFASDRPIRGAFEKLFTASHVADCPERDMRIYAALLTILERIEKRTGRSPDIPAGGELWWKAERTIRQRRFFRPTLDDLAEMCLCSRASVVRACHKTTGSSPMQRVRRIRMAEARGLLMFSTLNVTQVAQYLGYQRLHEFSREFSRYFHTPPSRVRHKA
ncbi:MAG: AraC family transcriptional regulator [Phycisphaerae bacterium]|nr:AraC family transcriptional regulator [Phycisphaerae bacterium]